MALVGINPVQQQQQASKLDKIAYALQIAQGVLGTALDIPRFMQERELKKAELDAIRAGNEPLSEVEIEEYRAAGVPEVALPKRRKDIEGAQRFLETGKERAAREDRELMRQFAMNAELRAQRAEGRTIEKEEAPKELSQPTIQTLDEGKAIPKQLRGIADILEKKPDLFGPIKGTIGQANVYDPEAQLADSKIRTVSQAFGRYMEGGVLRKEDEEKYRRMFPNLTDTPEVAAGKLSTVNNMLQERQNSLVQSFKAQGFNVSGFEGVQGDIDEDGKISDAEKWIMDNPRDKRVPDMIEAIKLRKAFQK